MSGTSNIVNIGVLEAQGQHRGPRLLSGLRQAVPAVSDLCFVLKGVVAVQRRTWRHGKVQNGRRDTSSYVGFFCLPVVYRMPKTPGRALKVPWVLPGSPALSQTTYWQEKESPERLGSDTQALPKHLAPPKRMKPQIKSQYFPRGGGGGWIQAGRQQCFLPFLVLFHFILFCFCLETLLSCPEIYS